MTHHRSASERRREIQENAARIGIDEDYIALLVETFYARIQDHPDLGPIFASRISDWDSHLDRMKRFWSSVTLNSGKYSGQPVPAHAKLTNAQPEHFGQWLGLFEQTLNDTAPHPETPAYFMERANRIANSLQLAMFGVPELSEAKT